LTKITRKKSGRHAMNGLLCSWPQSKNRLKPLLFRATKNGGITQGFSLIEVVELMVLERSNLAVMVILIRPALTL